MKSKEHNLPDFEEILQDVDIDEMVGCWLGYYDPFGITVIGKTKEDCLEGIKEAYNTHK